MKRYQSHKVVEAAKILGIRTPDEGAELVLSGEEAVMVDLQWLSRHASTGKDLVSLVGGYFVRYADGYESWSPAAPFEEGYSLIE